MFSLFFIPLLLSGRSWPRLEHPSQRLLHVDVMVIEPFGGQFGGVLWVIVLLENDIVGGQSLVRKGTKEGLREDFAVLDCIHAPLDTMKAPWSLWCDASPHH